MVSDWSLEVNVRLLLFSETRAASSVKGIFTVVLPNRFDLPVKAPGDPDILNESPLISVLRVSRPIRF